MEIRNICNIYAMDNCPDSRGQNRWRGQISFDKAKDNDCHVSAPPPASSFATARFFYYYDVMSLFAIKC